jgi:hypothetical protein
VNINIFIDLGIAVAIAIGLGVSDLLRAPGAVFMGLRLPAAGALLLLTAIAGAALTAETTCSSSRMRDEDVQTVRSVSRTPGSSKSGGASSVCPPVPARDRCALPA